MTRTTLFLVLAGLLLGSACIDAPESDDLAERRKPNRGHFTDLLDAGPPEPDPEPDAGSGSGTDAGSSTEPDAGTAPGPSPDPVMLSTGCAAYDSGVYTPFVNYGPVTLGTVASYPWRGPSGYPDGLEDFRAYTTLPSTVECSSNKSLRNYLDVTSGCLTALSFSGGTAGRIQLTASGGYRSFALPYDPQGDRQVAWQDQGVQYRFYYSNWTPTGVNPGFKAFVRYMTEYDLYVASWRQDGVVQIQKKQCGAYTILKRNATYGAPSPNAWHTIRFEVVGSELRLFLDGQLAMTTTDSSIKTGTAGIRIDAADASYVDDWRVYAP